MHLKDLLESFIRVGYHIPVLDFYLQWNLSCEATPFAPEKWPFKRGGLSSGWPLKRGSTVVLSWPSLLKKHYNGLNQTKPYIYFYFQATHLDPCLDDSVMFAKRLSSLGKEVHLEALEDLPHGFLNFVLISGEAKHGSDRVVRRISQVLHLQADTYNDEDWDEIGEDEASH